MEELLLSCSRVFKKMIKNVKPRFHGITENIWSEEKQMVCVNKAYIWHSIWTMLQQFILTIHTFSRHMLTKDISARLFKNKKKSKVFV